MNDSPLADATETTLEQLIELHDQAFVTKAYEVILGRAPDPGGLSNYLAQVRSGVHKAQIIAELAQSTEGRLKGVDLPGMRAIIARYHKGVPNFLHSLFRRLTTSSIEPTERQLRIIDNRLYLMEQSLLQQAKQLDSLLKLVRQDGLHSVSPRPRGLDNDDAIHAPPLSHLPPKLARTFVDLKAIIATKRPNS
jgi:hypothetical protein